MDYLNNLKILRDAIDKESPEAIELWGWRSDCETTCCAAGLAAKIPYFQNLGLKVRRDGSPYMNGATVGYCDADKALNALFLPFPTSLEPDSTVAYDYLFIGSGEGLWDQKILGNGEISDKDLALARLDIAIMNWKLSDGYRRY